MLFNDDLLTETFV